MEAIKIVFIYDSIAKVGGIERIFVDKMNYFANVFKWDITLITYEQGTHPITFHLSEKVKHIDLNCRFFKLYRYSLPVRILKKSFLTRKFIHKFNNIINELKPDVIICTTNDLHSLRAINKCKQSCVKIAESHSYTNVYIDNKCNPNVRLLDKINNYEIRNKVKNMDLIVCLTKRDADCWRNIKRSVVIPNIVTSYPKKINYDTNSKHAIAVGRLVPQKGFDILIDIWKIVNQKNKEWILDIYGTGEEKDKLLKRINNNGLNEYIIIHEPVSNIYDKYQESGLFILSSRYEGFGLVLVEAMANGLPSVSFDCPCGPSDIMGEDNEFLVPQYDLNTFAEKICLLIENPEKRIEQSKKNRLLSERYTSDNVMPQWKNLYEELI